MRVFDQFKINELKDYDLEKGYLKNDKIFVAYHPAIQAVEGKFHYEVVREYENGGKDVKKVWDIPPVEATEAYEEYEDIKVYIPYTEQEKKMKYPDLVEKYIRAKYTLSDELAILRQRDTKPDEFNEYNYFAESCKLQAKIELGMI